MNRYSQTDSSQQKQFFSQEPVWRWLIIGFLFITAFGIRLYQIEVPPMDFHPTRQYHSALIARSYYYETSSSIPDWKKRVALINAQREGTLEPPIMEIVSSFAYGLTGGEHLWIPRLLSSLFWLFGGMFLYLIAKKLSSMDAALVSTAIFLFLPFGITASRSFQPDPAMIMMLLLSIFAILRYYERPRKTILMTAAVASAIAILIKPVCLFLILGAFFSLAICRHGVWKSIISKDSLIFIGICLAGILFYVSGMIFDQGKLRMQANYSLVPQLLWEPFFWKNWLKQIHGATGIPAFIVALFGVLLFRERWQRGLMIGLWIGYFIFGLVFTFHIHTHNYYQLQLIPIVALSLGPVGELLFTRLNNVNSYWVSRIAIYGILFLALLLNSFLYIQSRQKPPKSYTRISHYEREMRIAKEIGEAVEHSTRTIILAKYSEPIKYHGEIAGRYWPDLGEIITWGDPEASVEKRFQSVIGEDSYEYFIVTNVEELETQTGLKEFLISKFPTVVANDEYMIFDLRQGVDLEN